MKLRPEPETPIEKMIGDSTLASREELEKKFPRVPMHPGIYFLDLPRGEQLFTYIPQPESGLGPQLDIAATTLNKWAETQAERIQIPLQKTHYDLIMKWRGIEEPRIKRLNSQWGHKPLLVIETEDGMHIFVDGNHRYVWLYRNGYREANAYLVKYPKWVPFTVHGFPLITESELLSSYSGVQ